MTVGALANGAYSYAATATDAAGNTSAPSAPLSFTVDTTTITMGDVFVWTAVSGTWDNASNWTDQTTGADPATVAPGANDAVTINAASGIADVITGTGDFSSLTLTGSVALAGQFSTGTLNASGNLILNSGDSLGVSGAASLSGSTQINGALTIGGDLMTSGVSGFNVGSGGTLAVAGTSAAIFPLRRHRRHLSVTGNVSDQSPITMSSAATLTVGGTLSGHGDQLTRQRWEHSAGRADGCGSLNCLCRQHVVDRNRLRRQRGPRRM